MELASALEMFWQWRLASTPVEVDWYVCAPGGAAKARVSVDGLVAQVESSGFVRVAGEGREIELDLRECSFARARPKARVAAGEMHDPETILRIDFPSGEVCLVTPNRRVASSLPVGGQIVHGLQWSKYDLSLLRKEEEEEAAEPAAKTAKEPEEEKEKRKAPPPKIVKIRPPMMPVIAVMLTTAVIMMVVIPLQIPRDIADLLFTPRSVNDPKTTVWVRPSEGSYYCAGSVMYGRGPGRSMEQGRALTLGYQPALGRYCPSGEKAGGDEEAGTVSQAMAEFQARGERVLSWITRVPGELWAKVRY